MNYLIIKISSGPDYAIKLKYNAFNFNHFIHAYTSILFQIVYT